MSTVLDLLAISGLIIATALVILAATVGRTK